MKLKKHEINIYPEMETEERQLLKESLAKGFDSIFPIIVYENCVLDGWNRYTICQELDVEPVLRTFEGTTLEAIQFVDASNSRRNLNTFQRCEIALQRESFFREMAKENKRLAGKEARNKQLGVLPMLAKPQNEQIDTREETAKIAQTSHGTYAKAKTIIEKATPKQLKKVKSGESSINKTYQKIKKAEKIESLQEKVAAEHEASAIPSLIIHGEATNFNDKCDLLITDPPYMTDVEDINEFAKWLPAKLKCVKDTGFAFVFIGAYPEELNAYLNIAMPEQVLVWTYRNTLGAAPKNKYKLNWQAILFFRMSDSPELDCPITNELWAVQDVNAPDGRHKGRYHAWEKPIELAERLIRHTTKKGDLILDCYAGTGTFLLAGSRLGRKTIGYETDSEMVDIAIKKGCTLG